MVKVSIVIKALNEEENIVRAIETSLAALNGIDGEIVVADSGSTDRTIDIASEYPIIVVQLKKFDERCCGISPQLGYQHCSGEYIYILDGDMALDAKFIETALGYLDANPRVAGVGGVIPEMRIANIEFHSRVRRQARRRPKHGSEVECINGGGLYRRSAIANVQYLSDRNLHSYEEFDLGVRLRAKGWTLLRLDNHAADHYGYTMSTYRLLWRRMRTGYVFGAGEVVRAAFAGHYVRGVLTGLPGLRPAIGVWLYWPLAFAAADVAGSPTKIAAVFIFAALAPIAAMTVRNTGSLAVGVHSVATWHISAYGLLMGLLRKRKNPLERIESRLISPTNDQPRAAALVSGRDTRAAFTPVSTGEGEPRSSQSSENSRE